MTSFSNLGLIRLGPEALFEFNSTIASLTSSFVIQISSNSGYSGCSSSGNLAALSSIVDCMQK